MASLTFYFDYVSPYSYLAQTQLAGLGVAVEYVPFDLPKLMDRVKNAPTTVICEPKRRYAGKDLQRWAGRYAVPFAAHPAGREIDSRRLLRATLAAAESGDIEAAVAAIFGARWASGAPLSSAADVARVLASAGFGTGALEARIDDAELDQALDTNTDQAEAAGVFGSPTMFVGREQFFGNDRLDFVREALAHLD